MELLERTALLADLRASVAAATRGAGRVVIIDGEAGVGKSSVLRAVVTHAGPGIRTLWGACDLLMTPRPLGPLADMASRGAQAASCGGLFSAQSPDALRYRRVMTSDELPTCALCGDPIGDGEAWMAADDGGRAHSGCVYRHADGDERDRWMPPETTA